MKKPFETLVVGGCEYQLRITTAYAVKLEDDLGIDMLAGIEKLNELGTLAKYLFAATVSRNDSINKLEDVYQLIDDYLLEDKSLEDLQQLILDVLVTSGYFTEEGREHQKKMAESLKVIMEAELEKTMAKAAQIKRASQKSQKK